MRTTKQSNQGFTVLEVVLVLAIAGMIFLMVFIALPQMRRSQRDTERRDDMMMFVEAVKKFQQNNRGVLPGTLDKNGATNVTEEAYQNNSDGEFTWTGFYRKYLDPGTDDNQGVFRDPLGNFYALNIAACGISDGTCIDNYPPDTSMDYTVHVFTGATCKDENAIASSNPRDFAALYRSESSGVICYDSRN